LQHTFQTVNIVSDVVYWVVYFHKHLLEYNILRTIYKNMLTFSSRIPCSLSVKLKRKFDLQMYLFLNISLNIQCICQGSAVYSFHMCG